MEPSESQFVNHSNATAGEEAWRAEVASRVSSYRARRKGTAGDDRSQHFDFGPAVPEQSFDETPARPAQRTAPTASRNAFDTNYYRRLNAESLAQAPTVLMSATATAAAPALDLALDVEPEPEAATATVEDVNDTALDLEIRPEVTEDSFFEQLRIDAPPPDAEPEPEPEPVKATPQSNVIIFRRPLIEPPLVPQPSRDELAERIDNRPRILEVPEDIMPPVQGSLFPEIRLDGDEQELSHPREPEFEMPLRVAMIADRVTAAFMDVMFVGAASALFAGLALRALSDVPHTKPFWMLLGATPLLFWVIYQQIFLLYAGQTPGMKMKGIRLITFEGRTPAWEQRSARARFVLVSMMSVALGFLWAVVDEDSLCWHDRLSQTFPTSE